MSGFTFVSDIFQFVTDLITDSIGSNVAAINHQLGLVMMAAFGLYAVYIGYNLMMSNNSEMLKEGLKIFILLGVVTTIALKSNYYITNIVPIVLNLGDDIGGLISGAGGGAETLDKFLTTIYTSVHKIWDEAEFNMIQESNMFESLATIIMLLIGTVPFALTTFGILLTAKFMVALLLSIGTIFICFAFFPQTRSWFQQWISMCWNYVLIAMLFPIALSIEIKAIERFIFVDNELGIEMITAFKLMIVLLAFVAISTQIPTLASSLSGGVGINGMSGTFGAMMNPVTSAFKGGKQAALGAKGAAFSTGRGAKGLYNFGQKAHDAAENYRKNNIKTG
ncbi:type IV secretion system protein [Photobacterium damselae]|uniref:type IV secretion system protein n=1 Tax=Photobacterium damselae TaxID=38293 RepID=UPI0010FF4DB3|nr:type IV secretion system protein [Photobacterium damselae]TLS73430.1 type IV secretion system protein [Photobacterium damselae subsp. damselae]